MSGYGGVGNSYVLYVTRHTTPFTSGIEQSKARFTI